jgi:AcrR family transcriptional regulator
MKTHPFDSHPGARRAPPALMPKQRPSQQRSIDTYEHILSATATLLGDIGVENLSTNAICKSAGVTPPALYRYFPNKYAILKELGTRLMDRQNDLYLEWLAEGQTSASALTREQSTARLAKLQGGVNRVTMEFPAAVWIMRALRAVPSLHQVRLDSHTMVSQRSFEDVRSRFPNAASADLQLATRLATEVLYSATEMVFENPDIDPDRITAEVSDMVVRYFDKFREAEAALATKRPRKSSSKSSQRLPAAGKVAKAPKARR